AGYTLAMQMGVHYDRLLDGFEGPFEKVTGPLITSVPGGTVAAGGSGWTLSARYNDAITAAERLMKAGVPVHRLTRDAIGRPAGTFYIPSTGSARPIVQALAAEKGLRFEAASSAPPSGDMIRLRPVRIGLADVYGGSMPSGWIRWLLEQMEVPFEVVYVARLDQGDLARQFDLLIFADGLIPANDSGGGGPFGRQPAAEDIPAEFRGWLGRVSVAKTVPQLRSFLEAGGKIVTIGSSTNLARHLGLPVANHLVERQPSGTVRPLPRERFYVPASLLEVAVDSTLPAAWGLPSKAIVMFDESPVFRLDPGALADGRVKPVAWFASAAPLRSGWAWGQTYLEGGIAVAEAKVGKGMLYLFGPEITYRAQPAGTFKFLFNAILN
ncbi:MAG TPA: peptidase, partial [Gemmatimonadales bacterium]|nr:peptidase [Gemmatimonadales bacterium]